MEGFFFMKDGASWILRLGDENANDLSYGGVLINNWRFFFHLVFSEPQRGSMPIFFGSLSVVPQ